MMVDNGENIINIFYSSCIVINGYYGDSQIKSCFIIISAKSLGITQARLYILLENIFLLNKAIEPETCPRIVSAVFLIMIDFLL